MQVIEEWVGRHSSDEVMAAMNAARVPSGPILSTADIMAEPQYQERGMFHTVAPPSGARYVRCARCGPCAAGAGAPDAGLAPGVAATARPFS